MGTVLPACHFLILNLSLPLLSQTAGHLKVPFFLTSQTACHHPDHHFQKTNPGKLAFEVMVKRTH
jgi:hypothetical protein